MPDAKDMNNVKKISLLLIISTILFIIITYLASLWQPLGEPNLKEYQQVSDYTYQSKNTNFQTINTNQDNSIKLKFEFKLADNNSYSNIFQTDFLNNGIRLELNKSDLSLIVRDIRYLNDYFVYSFKTKIKKNTNYKFELLAIKNVGYIVKLNDESYSHIMHTFKPSFNNFIIGKGYNEKRFFIGEINNIKNFSWVTNPYSALFFEIRKNILYLTAYNNTESSIDINSFYDVSLMSKLRHTSVIYFTSFALIFFIGFISSSKYYMNNFYKTKVKSNFIIIALLLIQAILIANYSFYSYFIISILLLYIFGYLIFKYLFLDSLKDQMSLYIFPPMFGLIFISIIGGYSITLGFNSFLLLFFIATVSVSFILRDFIFDLRAKNSVLSCRENFCKILVIFSLIVTPIVFVLLNPLINNADTSFVRIGPDMFFYAKMAQFISDGGFLEASRLRIQEFEGLSTGDINKYSDATASWPFMYFYRWGLGFYQYLSIIISSSKHAYEIIFTSLVIPYIYLSTIVFFWLYKKIKLSLYISLLGFIAFIFNANMINIWYEGFYANIYSLFMFAIFMLIFSIEKNLFNRSKVENLRSIGLYIIILISIIMTYSEGLFFVLAPFIFLIVVYDYVIKKDFNYSVYRNIIISGVMAILFVLPCGFFVEWAETAIKQMSQEGGNGFMQPKWALPHEILGFSNIYNDITLTNGGQRIGRMPIDWIYSSIIFFLFFVFYSYTIKKHFKKISSIYAVSHILVALVGILIFIKSRQNNYLYMKYYTFLLPFIFLFFWEYISNCEILWKSKKNILPGNKKNIMLTIFTILISSSGISYISKYSSQANYVPKNQIEIYNQLKNIDFSESIIYPLKYEKYLNVYPALIKSHFISPSFRFKHAKKISDRKVYILIEKFDGEKYLYKNNDIIFENNNHIIIDSNHKLKNYMNEKTQKIDFEKITKYLNVK